MHPGPAARRIHHTVDVSIAGQDGQQLMTAVTVCLPADRTLGDKRPAPIVFAFPGGGYRRSYFDLEIPGHPGYSMAEHFTARGIILVACDYLGSGESTLPLPYGRLTLDRMNAANHAVVQKVHDLLEAELDPADGPPAPRIGLGHSLGAGLVTVQQELYRDFDGLVLLGRPIGGTHIPAPPAQPGLPPEWRESREQLDEVEANSERVDGYYLQRRRTEWQRYLFYWDDVPDEVIQHDEQSTTTLPVNVAREIGGLGGPNATAAAALEVPVFLGFGERDLSQDPRSEPRAYPMSRDIQLLILPGSAHCHNFSANRSHLWDRICGWIRALPVS
jgi:alpha-beta hydrolase superfamily lysophospholipase